MHVLSLLSLASLALAAPNVLKKRAEAAPLIKVQDSNPSAKIIPNRYIVKLSATATGLSVAQAQDAIHTYSSGGFKGFAAELDEAALEAVRNHPDVEYVEQDQVIEKYDIVSQKNAPWGLQRISHKQRGPTDYVYDSSAGAGTCVYIIDTGIKVDHEEFEGRAEWLRNFTEDGEDVDSLGHGTWVAGLVASRKFGVAKKAKVFALKVFAADGSASGSGIIAAMDFAAKDSATRQGCPKGFVANMSLGGGFSKTSNDATDAMVKAGVFVAVAAGNSNVDAAETSPASAPLACTVAASDQNDAKASFSSFGKVIDVWAPGVSLESTSYEGGSTSASGTSGSSPIVAGLGAYLMALEGIKGGEGVCKRIKDLSVKGVLTGVPSGTVNQLAFNGASS